MARVSIEDLEIAREWLSINEGEAGEKESCERVCAWIEAEIKDREIKAVARATGITPGSVRRELARRQIAE